MKRLLPVAATVVFAAVSLSAPAEAQADAGKVNVLILKENSVGSSSSAQGYVDKLMEVVAAQNGWTGASGTFETTRDKAASFISAQHPDFAILSLAAFLSFDKKHKLEVLGSAEVTGAGERQYHIISASQGDLESCKGKSLAVNLDDDWFVDHAVSGKDFDLADFKVVRMRRPMQTVKAVTRGEAECALVDDAQLGRLGKVDGGDAVKSVWSSAELPPMVIVAFPSAGAGEKRSFSANLKNVCSGEGKSVCAEVGLRRLGPMSSKDKKALDKLGAS